MEWITWFDLEKYNVVSMYVEKPKYNLHNPGEQAVVIDMLHYLNDYPPMKLTFKCHKVAGKIIIANVINSLNDEYSGIRIPAALARELKEKQSETVKNLLMMLTWS